MSKLKIIEGFVIILLFKTSEALKEYERLALEQGNNAIVHYDFSDGRLLYTTCTDDRSELKCDIFREKTAYQNDTYSCEFALKTGQLNGTVNFKISLNGFGKDKALIGWEDNGETKYFKFSIIDLSSCEISETKLIADKKQSLNDYTVLIYDDTYDIIFENVTLCGEKLCKMTVDGNSKVTSGPTGYFDNIAHRSKFKAAHSSSSSKRYFFIRRENDETSYHLVKPDGSIKSLTQVKNMLPPFYTSTSHSLFGMCYTIQLSSMFDTEIKCAQYDVEGNLTLEMTLKDLNRTKMLRYMHNLPEGGFVFVDEDYVDCEPHHCSVRFIATKFDGKGEKIGSLDLGQRCKAVKARAWTSFFENEDHDYCLAWTCRADDTKRIHITLKCFNDTDFL